MTAHCTKIAFTSEEEAREELHRIVEGNDWRSWKRLSPKRYYYCPHCNKYHLTSKSSIYELF